MQVGCTINYDKASLWKGTKNRHIDGLIYISDNVFGFSEPVGELSNKVGLWRSWERASMAWKRSSVRSRPGPPSFQQLSGPPSKALAGNFQKPSAVGDDFLSSRLIASIVAFTPCGISCM